MCDNLPIPDCSAQAVQDVLLFIYKGYAAKRLPLYSLKPAENVLPLCHKFNCPDALNQYDEYLASKVSDDGSSAELWVSSLHH